MRMKDHETANCDPARDLRGLLKHITSHAYVTCPRGLSAPMSSSAFGPHTAPKAQPEDPAAGGSKAGVGPQLPRSAGGPRTRLGHAAGGASRGMRPESTMRKPM